MFLNAVLVDSNLDETRCVKLASWKEDFEGILDSSGINSLEFSREEWCDVSKNADECEDEDFSLNEGCKSAKVFLRKKESIEEEKGELNFLGSSEEEGEFGSEGGKELSELTVSMKYLDPLPFLKIVLTFLSSNFLLKAVLFLWIGDLLLEVFKFVRLSFFWS